MIRIAVCLTALALWAAPRLPVADVDGPPAAHVEWVPSWKEALAIAKAENRPIMIHFNMDDEPACEGMARGHFKNPKLVELSKKFVCVVGSLGDHTGENIIEGEEGTCRRFGSLTCAEHRTCEPGARGDVLGVSRVTAPQFIFTDPELNILVRKPWDTAPGDVIKLMERALTYFDPSMEASEVAAQRKRLIKDMLKEADSDNAAKRKKAMDVLASRDDPEIIEFLIRQTSGDVDEVKRLAAIDAIGAAGNANCVGRLIELLKDRSSRIRRNTIVALNNLGMLESVAPLLKKFRNEPNSRNQALIVRAVVNCDANDKDVRKLLATALKHKEGLVRSHAIRSCLSLDPVDGEFQRLLKMVRSEKDSTVKRLACHAATRLTLDSKDIDTKSAKTILKSQKKLEKSLKGIARSSKDDDKAYFSLCLAALQGEDIDLAYEDTTDFFDEDTIFDTDDLSGGTRPGRRGR